MSEGDAPEQELQHRKSNFQRLFSADTFLERLTPRLQSFGITRLADVTGLDRVGVPVVQTIRPLARSNIVSQGKGLTLAEAAVTSAMESLETFAGEQVDKNGNGNATPGETYGPAAAEILCRHLLPDADDKWHETGMPFVTGADVLSGAPVPVPAALVSTDYTPASPHADTPFQRTTTGLGGGATPDEALLHGLFETLERFSTAKATQTHGFFEKTRFDPDQFMDSNSRRLAGKLKDAGILFAVYECPAVQGLPVIWTRLLDASASPTSLPFCADGFACRETVADALTAALLEAVQTRVSVIAGGREDITWQYYPRRPDEDLIAFERAQMHRKPAGRPPLSGAPLSKTPSDLARMLKEEGQQTVAVPLMSNSEIPLFITRVVTLGIPNAEGN